MKKFAMLSIVAFATLGCEKSDTAVPDDAGSAVEGAADDAAGDVEEAGEGLEESADEAAGDVEEAAEGAEEGAEEAAEE